MKLVLIDGDLTVKELESVRTVALYLKIDSSSWYRTIGNVGSKSRA